MGSAVKGLRIWIFFFIFFSLDERERERERGLGRNFFLLYSGPKYLKKRVESANASPFIGAGKKK